MEQHVKCVHTRVCNEQLGRPRWQRYKDISLLLAALVVHFGAIAGT